jgi:hypothetical protein
MADKKKGSDPTPTEGAQPSAADITVIDVDAPTQPEGSRKKRKIIQGSISNFLDQAMTTAQKNSADKKLLRSV